MTKPFFLFCLSLFLSVFSISASSAEYRWARYGQVSFATPAQSCEYNRTRVGFCSATECYGHKIADNTTILTKESETAFRCDIYAQPSNTKYSGIAIERTGDSCSPGKIYDSSTGACNTPSCPSGQVWDPSIGFCITPNPCTELSGQTTGFKISGNTSDQNSFYQPAGGSWVHPNQVTNGPAGCNATVERGVKCKVYGNGDYYCTGNATYDGIQPLPGESGAQSDGCEGDNCPEPDDTPTNDTSSDCSPWVYGEYGLERNCTTNSENERPGKGSCTTDGSLICVKPSPTPVSTKTTTDTNEKKVTDTETGNTTTIKIDVINKTICLAGSCTTTTTTNKTTVVNNAAGDKIGSSGSCTGPGCASSTNPDADGDGLGDCIKDCGEEEEQEEGSALHSESCDAAPACDGDPFQCAILLQSHYNSCKEREPFTPEQQEEVDETIDAAYAANEEAQEDLDGQVSGFFSDFKSRANGNSQTGNGSCLADKTFSFMNNTITLPFSMVCPFIAFFRMALIAMAYLFAARIISTQV